MAEVSGGLCRICGSPKTPCFHCQYHGGTVEAVEGTCGVKKKSNYQTCAHKQLTAVSIASGNHFREDARKCQICGRGSPDTDPNNVTYVYGYCSNCKTPIYYRVCQECSPSLTPGKVIDMKYGSPVVFGLNADICGSELYNATVAWEKVHRHYMGLEQILRS